MAENLYYTLANEKIKEFVCKEWKDFPQKLFSQYINFLSSISFYEEEGVKIRPNILITNDIEQITEAVPSSYTLEIFEDENENQFNSRMKALAPFCTHDWNIYLSVENDRYKYGLYKALNSIKDKDFNTVFLSKKALKAKTDSLFAILVEVYSTFCINLKTLKGEELNINFALQNKKSSNWKDEVKEFVDASFSKYRTTLKKLDTIKTLYNNIFSHVFKNVHGALCIVIDKDYVDDGFLKDGIWLKEPIYFSKILSGKNYTDAKLIGLSNLFIDMLNYDGITVIDNLGRIRAYNVFVKTDSSQNINILGGGRKRAAFTIINYKNKKIKGVYFQSQEGEIFYQRVRHLNKTEY